MHFIWSDIFETEQSSRWNLNGLRMAYLGLSIYYVRTEGVGALYFGDVAYVIIQKPLRLKTHWI